MRQKIDLVVFDWDGTLMDSAAKIVTCMQLAAQDLGLEVPSCAAVEDIIGLGLPQAVERLFPALGSEGNKYLQKQYAEHYVENDKTHTPLFPGVEHTLTSLRGQGYKLAVATGKSRRGLNRVFATTDIGGYFESSRCADETASKPHPLMLEELLSELNCKAERTLMVGDSEYDMEMARNAGVGAVAVDYGVHSLDRLRQFNPLYCLSQIDELIKCLCR